MRKIIYVITVLAMLLNVSCEKISDMKLFKKETLQEKFDKKMPELKSMSELGCVEYTVSKVIIPEGKKDSKWYGTRTIAYSCVAHIKAGINMSKIRANIDEEKKSIDLILPKPTLIGNQIDMPMEKIKVIYEKSTGVRSKYTNEERLEIKKKGEAKIKEEIPKLGIYETAEKNAEAFFRTLLVEMGIRESGINIKFE